VSWRVEILNETVAAEIAALPSDMQARFLRLAERIAAAGLENLSEPHVKHLEGKLWELRLTGRDGIARALCHGHRSKGRRGSSVRQEDTKDAAHRD
jgi:phage-related protein